MEESTLGPAGSLEPINTEKGKWTDNLGALELSELSGLATDINKTVDQTVKHVARGKIKVGKLLLEAREHFHKDDIAFGKWRVENTLVQSKQHAHYLMQVAEQFGNATVLIDGANYSVMQELVTADQADIQWVVDRIDAGDPPKVTEVRKKVKQTQAERLAPKGTSKKGVPIDSSKPMYVPNAHINSYVKLSLTLRIKGVLDQQIKGIEGDLIIIGMDPDPQCPCATEVLDAIEAFWDPEEGADHTEEQHNVFMRSMERVREEFENWDKN